MKLREEDNLKVLIDSNILVSAAYSRNGTTRKAYNKAVSPPYQGMICEQSIEEFRRICGRKFPEKTKDFEAFIAEVMSVVEIIPVPPSKHPDEDEIRDIDDRPILRAAIKAGVDILLTGDKDFTESTITNPKIVKAAAFVNKE